MDTLTYQCLSDAAATLPAPVDIANSEQLRALYCDGLRLTGTIDLNTGPRLSAFNEWLALNRFCLSPDGLGTNAPQGPQAVQCAGTVVTIEATLRCTGDAGRLAMAINDLLSDQGLLPE